MGNLLGRPSNDGRPARKKNKSAGRRKKKDEFLDSNRKRADLEDDKEEGPQMALQEMYKLLAQRRIATRKTLSVARWRPDRGLAEAMVMKGNMWQNMGIVRSGRNYCQVEEALYMVERGSLLLLLGSEPASVQQVHSLLLHQGRSLQAYHAYCNLRKLGYVVQRYDTPWVHPASQNRRKSEAEKKGIEGVEGDGNETGGADVEGGECVGGVNGGENGDGAGEKGEEKVKGAKVKGAKVKGGTAKTEKNEKFQSEGVTGVEVKGPEAGEEGVETENAKKGKVKKEKVRKEKVKKEKGGKGKDGKTEEGAVEDARSASPPRQGGSEVGRAGSGGEPNGQAMEPPRGTAIDGGGIALASDSTDEVREGVRTEASAHELSGVGSAGKSAPGNESQNSESGHELSNRAAGSDGATGSIDESVGGVETSPGETSNETEKGSNLNAAGFEVGPGLNEESVANAATEDFRKGPVSGGPAGRKRQSPGPLDLNEACTFVNLNVKNYHPLAAYLFVGQPKKQGRPMTDASDQRTNCSVIAIGVGGSEMIGSIDSVSEVQENGQGGVSAADPTSRTRPDDVAIDIVETASPAAPNRLTSSDATSAALPAESAVSDVVSALHSILDLSRCTMPPPIPKPSTWQRLTWHLRRILRWRWWPWRWGRRKQREELGLGRTMRPLSRTVDERPRGSVRATRGKVFPDDGRSSSVDLEHSQGEADVESGFLNGASENAREKGGRLQSGLWRGNEEERLEAIRGRGAAVYDVWQPNSRFRKTDPGRPYFRLIIAGAQPPTRREIRFYREIYGGEGIPLKYCFVEMTGASTFFSYDPVTLPSVL